MGDSKNIVKSVISTSNQLSVVSGGPFYLLKKLPKPDEVIGYCDLLQYYGLDVIFKNYSNKKIDRSLSAYLPSLSGKIDFSSQPHGSSLKQLLDSQPAVAKPLDPLSETHLKSLVLDEGPLPPEYMLLFEPNGMTSSNSKRQRIE